MAPAAQVFRCGHKGCRGKALRGAELARVLCRKCMLMVQAYRTKQYAACKTPVWLCLQVATAPAETSTEAAVDNSGASINGVSVDATDRTKAGSSGIASGIRLENVSACCTSG